MLSYKTGGFGSNNHDTIENACFTTTTANKPSSTTNANTNSKQSKKGLVTAAIAAAAADAERAAMASNSALPDRVFTASSFLKRLPLERQWGSIQKPNSTAASTSTITKPSAPKDEDKATEDANKGKQTALQQKQQLLHDLESRDKQKQTAIRRLLPRYIPTFLPPFPPRHTYDPYGLTTTYDADDDTNNDEYDECDDLVTADKNLEDDAPHGSNQNNGSSNPKRKTRDWDAISSRQDVRASLVQMGREEAAYISKTTKEASASTSHQNSNNTMKSNELNGNSKTNPEKTQTIDEPKSSINVTVPTGLLKNSSNHKSSSSHSNSNSKSSNHSKSSKSDAAGSKSNSAAAVVASGETSIPEVPPQVVPLSRPSGARVSKIIEGSMDFNPP